MRDAKKNKGVCVEHGAKMKCFSSEGCTKQAVKGGVCRSHWSYHEVGM
jgi:hypothetical protein